jgi:hypothetical protein
MSDTPRTEAAEETCRENLGGVNLVYVDDMAELERELNAMTAERDALKRRVEDGIADGRVWVRDIIDDRDLLLGYIERLLPHLPNMEPIGAARHAEHNVAAWELRQYLESRKGGAR